MSLILSTILACAIAKPQTPQWDLNQKVTYSTVAKSAKNICEELGNITKVPLETERQTSAEVLVIDVKEVPLKTLLDKIAKVSSAQWETGQSEMKLVRPAEVARKESKDEIAYYAAAIEKSMKAAAEKAAKATPYDEQSTTLYSQQYNALSEQLNGNPGLEVFDQLRALEQNSPVGRLADRLMSCLDAKRLAAMRQDECCVLSTAPNRLQYPFGPQASAAIQQFQKDWALWTSSADKIVIPQTRINSFADGLKSKKQPAKIVTVCKWAEMRTAIVATTHVITSDGFILAEITSTLSVDDTMDSLSRIASRPQKPTAEVPGTGITFSPLAQAWTSRARQLMEPIPGEKPADPAELDRWLISPTENDPLSLHPSEALLATAKSKSLNLVANLTDQSIMVSILAAMGINKSSDEYLDLFQKSSGMTFDNDGKWLEGKPILPSRVRRERFERPSLQMLIRAIKGKGFLSLDEMGAFCASNDRNAISEISMMGFLIMTGDMNSIGPLLEEFGILGLYGSLLPVQRSAMLAGSPLVYKDMAAEQRVRFERLIYGGTDRSMSRSYRVDDGGLASSSRIATEAFPNGPPPASNLTVTVKTKTIAQSTDRNRQGFTPDQIAMNILSKEKPEVFGGHPQELAKGYRMGTQIQYDFILSILSEMDSRCQIRISQVDQRQTPVPYSGLPKSFFDEIDKELIRLREVYKNVQPPTDPPVKKV